MTQDLILEAISGGFYTLFDYLRAHVLTCLVPAFFIAGAISALLPKEKVTKYLGRDVPKYKAYPLSVIAGLLLAVCSCTILPLFAGIKKKGAGIGPAIAFLYTAPATNILAIVFTGSVIGWDFALSRIVLSITFAIVIGLLISKMFKEEGVEDKKLVSELIREEEGLDGIGKA
ncbi:permease, partial [candidate division WWE3 bacterium CG_4_9_14_0_2_um_filter_48_10]